MPLLLLTYMWLQHEQVHETGEVTQAVDFTHPSVTFQQPMWFTERGGTYWDNVYNKKGVRICEYQGDSSRSALSMSALILLQDKTDSYTTCMQKAFAFLLSLVGLSM